MKNRFIATLILALVLVAALALPALAVPAPTDPDVRKTTKKVNVYAERDNKSTVLKKIAKGEKLLIEEDLNDWVSILIEDPNGDGQILGWVQSKYLECAHKWTEWVVDREATCSEAGQRSRYCTRCSKEQKKEIEKLKHDFGKWTVEREATCSKDGLRTRTCKVCNYKQEKVYREEHTYRPWEVTQEATCSVPGSMQRTCQVCGYVETQTIQTLPHTFEYRILVEATDHSAGTRAAVCQVCGYAESAVSYDPEGTIRRGSRGENVRQLQQLLADQGYLTAGEVDGMFGGGTERAIARFQAEQGLIADGVAWPQTQQRLNHKFGPWETVRAMTRTQPGLRRRVCEDCGYVQSETIESGEAIERGSRGENVRTLQQMLKQVGYDVGSFDGIYGNKLDVAFTAFDAAHGLTFEAGRVRPADVDALVSAWLGQGSAALSQSAAGNPINVALSMIPASVESDDANLTNYTWSITNLGSRKCTFKALLLTYGDTADFTRDDLVMVIDSQELKPNLGNILSGTLSVDSGWGTGKLNFAALAVDEETGSRWLSNVVVY